jgi:DivIVA domain-containing protein
MDLVKMLTSVEFSEVRRGLDRDEVAAFLQQVASSVMGLERRLEDTTHRAEVAEARAFELADDTSLRKTLVLAQRTADAAVAEAEDEARRIVSEAEQRAAGRIAEAEAHGERTRSGAEESASSTLSAAQAKSAQLLIEAKAEARRASEDLRGKLRKEVMDLESARDTLLRDVALFEAHMGEQRTRVQGALGALQMVLDHPDALRKMAIPPITPVTIPEAVIEPAPRLSAPPRVSAAAIEPTPARPRVSAMATGAAPDSIEDAMLHQAVADAIAAEPILDLSDRGNEIPIIEPEMDLRTEEPLDSTNDSTIDSTNETARVMIPAAGADDELARTFFEQSNFADERWKPRRDRRRG